MTSYPPPTWGDIDAFCEADGWEGDRDTDHAFWEKTLPNGEVLQTHRSFKVSEEIGPNLFGLILRSQLKVSRTEFWEAIRTGKPVTRPVDPLDEVPAYDAWVVSGLLSKGYTEDQIREYSPEDAKELLQRLWSEPTPS